MCFTKEELFNSFKENGKKQGMSDEEANEYAQTFFDRGKGYGSIELVIFNNEALQNVYNILGYMVYLCKHKELSFIKKIFIKKDKTRICIGIDKNYDIVEINEKGMFLVDMIYDIARKESFKSHMIDDVRYMYKQVVRTKEYTTHDELTCQVDFISSDFSIEKCLDYNNNDNIEKIIKFISHMNYILNVNVEEILSKAKSLGFVETYILFGFDTDLKIKFNLVEIINTIKEYISDCTEDEIMQSLVKYANTIE